MRYITGVRNIHAATPYIPLFHRHVRYLREAGISVTIRVQEESGDVSALVSNRNYKRAAGVLGIVEGKTS